MMKSKLLLLSLTAISIVAIASEKIAAAEPRTLPEYTAALLVTLAVSPMCFFASARAGSS
jgi:hypothetical protein